MIDAAVQSGPALGVKGRAEGEARTLMSVQRSPLTPIRDGLLYCAARSSRRSPVWP